MFKEITVDRLSPDAKTHYDNWRNLFEHKIKQGNIFIPYKDYHGEDKNLLSWQSMEEYIKWWGQPPGNEPYRDDGFYTRELTWLSEWCNPNIVVEIGTGHGMGTFLLDRLNPTAKIYTIDIADYADLPDKKIDIGFFAKFNKCDVLYFKNKPIVEANLIFIDGDHSENGVWEDSIWAWKHINKLKRWIIIWHDARQNNEEFRGLLKSLHRFSDYTRNSIYRFPDSSTVWMSGDPE